MAVEGAAGGGGGDSGGGGGSAGAGGSSGGGAEGGSGSPAAGSSARQVMPSREALERSSEREGRDDAGDEREAREGKPKKPPASKYKYKRGGKELEHTGEELTAQLSDEFEHEFVGPGRKPVKMNWSGISRAVQLSEGALERMKQAAEKEKRYQESIDWGKDPKNHGAFLESQLGVKDHRAWAQEIIKQQIAEEAELLELLKNNPDQYHSRMRENARKDLERQQAFDKHTASREQQQKEYAQRRAEVEREATDALKAVGLPISDHVKALAGKIAREYGEAGMPLEHADLAALTREAYVKDVFGWIDGHDDESLVKLLGDDRRKRIRELEIKSAKSGAKDKEREERAAAREQGGGNGARQGSGLSDADFEKKYGRPTWGR